KASREQIDQSLEKQAELGALGLEKWMEAQREPLTAIANDSGDDTHNSGSFREALRSVLRARPHWVGVRVLRSDGQTLAFEPENALELPSDIAKGLLLMTKQRSWAVDTDWSRGPDRGILLIAAAAGGGGAAVAQVDVSAVGEMLFSGLEFADDGILSVLGPQRRMIIYRKTVSESYLGKDMSDSPLLAQLGNQRTLVTEVNSPGNPDTVVYGLARAGATGCVVIVGIPSETLYAPARQLVRRYIIVSLAALLCATAAALGIARGIAGPVRRLTEAARRFGAGELTARATYSSSGEIEDLRKSFNSMAAQIEEREARLEEGDQLKSDFVSGVSHEMRTPLTTIKTLTRVLERGNLSEGERRRFLQTIAAECDRQIDLVLNLLDLSRIEAGTFNITLERVDVIAAIKSCVAAEQHNAEAHRHKLRTELPLALPAVVADGAALRRVIRGLMQNAIKYTVDGGLIVISAGNEHNSVRISVTDTGRGICDEDLPHIFEKFYRGRVPDLTAHRWTVGHAGSARSEPAGESEVADLPGVGLGLYLARAVIAEIGGSISVESGVGRGSTFTICLPRWDGADL
ncbi:MAG: ATP-binding protein, partial [Blastocatellia bacterium]